MQWRVPSRRLLPDRGVFVSTLHTFNTEYRGQKEELPSLVPLEAADQRGGVLRVLLLLGAEEAGDLVPGPAQRQLDPHHQHEAAPHQQRHEHDDLTQEE